MRQEVQGFIDNGLLTQNEAGSYRIVEDPREREYIVSSSKSKMSTMAEEPVMDRRKAKQFIIENSAERADSDEELENEL